MVFKEEQGKVIFYLFPYKSNKDFNQQYCVLMRGGSLEKINDFKNYLDFIQIFINPSINNCKVVYGEEIDLAKKTIKNVSRNILGIPVLNVENITKFKPDEIGELEKKLEEIGYKQ